MFKTIIVNLVLAYLVLLFVAVFFAEKMIFLAPRPGYVDSKNIIKLKTKTGSVISAIYLHNNSAKYTLLVSHGNAEDIGYMDNFLQGAYSNGFSVFAYDYSGYGTSSGKSTEVNSYADIDAAYDYLINNLHVEPQNIILYGHSLGAAISLDLAIRKPAAGLIMASPFVTAFRVLTVIPLIPFERFNSIKKIKRLTMPLLVIHGEDDEIITFWHGKKIYDSASGEKQFFWVKNAGHNNLLFVAGNSYWQTIHKFLKEKIEHK